MDRNSNNQHDLYEINTLDLAMLSPKLKCRNYLNMNFRYSLSLLRKTDSWQGRISVCLFSVRNRDERNFLDTGITSNFSII